MINQINTFSNKTLPFFQEKVASSLSDQFKKITLIALAAIACGVICYAIKTELNKMLSIASDRKVSIKKEPIGYCLLWVASFFMTRDPFMAPVDNQGQKDNLDDAEDGQTQVDTKKPDTGISDGKSEPNTPGLIFLKAMELMFHDRGLELGVCVSLDDMTPKQQNERHQELKNTIQLLPQAMINSQTFYRDGMSSRSHTLLLQAIMVIKDSAKRLEIVKMLLEKGADPLIHGKVAYQLIHGDDGYSPVDPIVEAAKTSDKELIACLDNALFINKLSTTFKNCF